MAVDEGTLDIQLAIAGVLAGLHRFPEFVSSAPRRVAIYYRLGAERAGFGAGQNLAITPLTEAFEARYGRESLWKMYMGANQQGWFMQAFRGNTPPRSTVMNALLIHFLFESVDAFAQFARSRLPEIEELEKGPERRQYVIAMPGQEPGQSTPSQLTLGWDDVPLEKDRSETLVWPKPIGARRAVLGFQEEELCIAVTEKYRKLTQEDVRPVRITTRMLLSGLPRSNTLMKPRSPFLRLKAMVNELTETTTVYRERLAAWMVLNLERQCGIDAAVVKAARTTQLRRRKVRELAEARRAGLRA